MNKCKKTTASATFLLPDTQEVTVLEEKKSSRWGQLSAREVNTVTSDYILKVLEVWFTLRIYPYELIAWVSL